MNEATTQNIINEIESFNNAVFTEKFDTKEETVFKFKATKFAAEGIAGILAAFDVRVLKWSGTDEYFFAVSTSNQKFHTHYTK